MKSKIIFLVVLFIIINNNAFANGKSSRFQKQCFKNAMLAHKVNIYCYEPKNKRERAICASATKKAVAIVHDRCKLCSDECKDNAMIWLNSLSKKNESSVTMHNVLINNCY